MTWHPKIAMTPNYITILTRGQPILTLQKAPCPLGKTRKNFHASCNQFSKVRPRLPSLV